VAGIAGSNPAEGIEVCLLVFVERSVGSDLCDDLITCSEGSYCMCVCVSAQLCECVCLIVCVCV
jgi:hypothetical protein